MDGTGNPGRLSSPHARGHPREPSLCPRAGEFGESLSERSGIMSFLADENVPIGVVEELVVIGHDVEWVGKITPGALDDEVLRQAAKDRRIPLTFDKDYGDLAHRKETTALPAGIVLIRSPVPRTRANCR